MRFHLDGTTIVGSAIDLRGVDTAVGNADGDVSRLRAAIDDPADSLLECAPSGDVHRQLGLVRDGMSFDRRQALIDAARSIGLTPPQAEAIADLEERINAIAPEDPELRAARKRAAEAAESVESLRERVARVSGRLEAAREADRDTGDLERTLAEATQKLTEAETEAAAARQALEAAETRAARDRRAERLSLVDRRDNRRREAREWLVAAAERRLETAVSSLPVDTSGWEGPGEQVDSTKPTDWRDMVTTPRHLALGILRIARVRAPVILVDSPFESALRARAALAAPVVLV